jgi:hypothetical protein
MCVPGGGVTSPSTTHLPVKTFPQPCNVEGDHETQRRERTQTGRGSRRSVAAAAGKGMAVRPPHECSGEITVQWPVPANPSPTIFDSPVYRRMHREEEHVKQKEEHRKRTPVAQRSGTQRHNSVSIEKCTAAYMREHYKRYIEG